MTRNRLLAWAVLILLAADSRGAEPAPVAAEWVDVSTPTIEELAAAGQKTDWPGETAGVAVDAVNGDVYMIVAGLGVWKSTDRGASFARCDAGAVGGRCESAYSLNIDPKGNRLACFMLDGKGALTGDAGKTWRSFTDVGRNWDYAAVDWSEPDVKSIFAGLHESGGQVLFSGDGGKSWNQLFEDPEFEKNGGLGIFNAQTLVYSQKGKGIQRSTDGGKSWSKVSDLATVGRVVRIVNEQAYWLGKEGLLVSSDDGATWSVQGVPVEASIGPMFDPKNDEHLVVAGTKGIFRTVDGGKSWQHVADLPAGADIPKPGWYSNVAWDPIHDDFYVSKMGRPTYRLQLNPR